MTSITGQNVLVIGGSRGIGAEIAKEFAREGANVALTYAMSPDRADEVVTEIENQGRTGLAIQADAGKSGANAGAIRQTVESLGSIDVLVAAAGTFDVAPISEIDADRYDYSFNLHVKGVFEGISEAQNHMASGGTIITIGSIFGDIAPFEGLSVYTASKAAVAGLTKAVARELGGRGITANSIQPGPINTEMNPGDPEMNPMAETQKSMTALGRYGETREIAKLATFLASDGGRFITGQTLNVDGGWTA